MTSLSKSAVADACPHRLTGHGVQTIQQSLLALANFVDPHLAKDVYGQGDAMRRFEELVARLLGKEAALFMPSGTMAQQIALRLWADRSGRTAVGMHPTCHLYMHENDAYAEMHGLEAVLLGEPTRQLVPGDLPSTAAGLCALVVELPQRHTGGSLPTWDELEAMRAWAKDGGAAFHLDGARLWESTVHFGKSEAEIAALFDSVYVSFYKGLGGIGGAALAGSGDMIEAARIWLRRHGGNLIHLFPLVVAAEMGLETYRPRMPAYVARAKEIAAVVAALAQIKATPRAPQANMMHLSFAKPPHVVEEAAVRVSAETGLWMLGGLWTRLFAPEAPVFELTVGEATMKAGIDLIARSLKDLDARLA